MVARIQAAWRHRRCEFRLTKNRQLRLLFACVYGENSGSDGLFYQGGALFLILRESAERSGA